MKKKPIQKPDGADMTLRDSERRPEGWGLFLCVLSRMPVACAAGVLAVSIENETLTLEQAKEAWRLIGRSDFQPVEEAIQGLREPKEAPQTAHESSTQGGVFPFWPKRNG